MVLGQPDVIVADSFSPDDLFDNLGVDVLVRPAPLEGIAKSVPQAKGQLRVRFAHRYAPLCPLSGVLFSWRRSVTSGWAREPADFPLQPPASDLRVFAVRALRFAHLSSP